MCCGTGRALLQAEDQLPDVEIVGLDLVDHFWPQPADSRVRFVVGPLREYAPDAPFDLITCVHGLHYVGDKLGQLARMRSWLRPEGRLGAHLDPEHVFLDGRADPKGAIALLKGAGFAWRGRKHLVEGTGPRGAPMAVTFVGARAAGPNYTGQPAVESSYGS